MDVIFYEFFRGSSITKFFFKTRNIVLNFFKESFTVTEIRDLKEKVLEVTKTFLELSRTVDPEEKVTPKLHQILHLPDLIKFFGPPYQSMTFRHERKHQDSKNVVRNIRCFKNLSKSLMIRQVRNYSFKNELKTQKWSLQKNIIRKFKNKEEFFEAKKFISDEEAFGNIFIIDCLNRKTKNVYLKLSMSNVKINIKELSSSNDFLYELPVAGTDETNLYLCKWPLL